MGRPKRKWELVGCMLDGHVHVGQDAAEVTPDDAPFVREHGGARWHRCLRCDGWHHLGPPKAPQRARVPSRDEVELPMRGRALRDRFVLRIIAIDRAIHVLVLVAIAIAIFVFVGHRTSLQRSYNAVMNALLGSSGGPHALGGWLGHLHHFFVFSPKHLDELAYAACAYAALEAAEMVGLWYAKRWAEYLTFVATCALLPLEIYELTTKLSVLKIVVFVINLAVAGYLLAAKRLFGVRGGGESLEREKAESSGWIAFDKASPPTVSEELAS